MLLSMLVMIFLQLECLVNISIMVSGIMESLLPMLMDPYVFCLRTEISTFVTGNRSNVVRELMPQRIVLNPLLYLPLILCLLTFLLQALVLRVMIQKSLFEAVLLVR